MKTLMLTVSATTAVLVGGALLLFVFPGALVQHPQLTGLNYCSAVLGRMFGPGAVRLTAPGVGLVLLGVVVSLRLVFPDRSDVSVSRGALEFLFCGLAAVGTLALLVLLFGITVLNLGLE